MLTIDLESNLKTKLQEQAEKHGRSLEEEVTAILNYHLTENSAKSLNLADRIKQRFSNLENIEIAEINRDKIRKIPTFE